MSTGGLRFGRLFKPNPVARVYAKATPMPMKTILARVTKGSPSCVGISEPEAPAISSGESWLVKASLNAADAVVSAVAMPPAMF